MKRVLFFVGLGLSTLVGPRGADAATPILTPEPEYREVEFFDAIGTGELEVTLIAKSAKEANLLITNKGDKPVSVKLPAALAGVPALRQLGGGMMGGGMGGMGGGMGGGGGGQGLGMGGGGGMGGMGGGMGGMGGGMGGGGGFFNVAPDKMVKAELPAVCLEHGKPDPTARMKYKVVPIEQVVQDPKVIEIVKMLGSGALPQNTAQAATWNLTDGLSWGELAAKDRVRLRNGYTEKYFAARELYTAMQAVQVAAHRAPKAGSGGKSDSLSNFSQ